MKTLFMVTAATLLLGGCASVEENLQPQAVHSGAKTAPLIPNLEDWGGVTLQPVYGYAPPPQPAPVLYYQTSWVGIPIKLTNMSYELTAGYGVAWGDVANYQDLHDMGVDFESVGTDGMFSMVQLNTGDSYGINAVGRVEYDANNVLGQIDWYPDPAEYYSKPDPDLRSKFIEALNTLKDYYQGQQESTEFVTEANKMLTNLTNNVPQNSVMSGYTDNSWLIVGRVVKKPDGGFGIVPPMWIPPQ
ncbi:hypothetical protein [Spirosoma koreense]